MSDRCGLQAMRRTAYSWPGSTATGPAPGARMSKVRIARSTPAVASTLSRYLFQSCVRASLGGIPMGGASPGCAFGGVWIGMLSVRWFDALVGVRKSKMRKWLSELTALRMLGECGLNWAL